MLAQSHARQPAPPLAARGMWLRLHGGADAFGSALGDAVVGSIVQAEREKQQRDQMYGLASGDGKPGFKLGGKGPRLGGDGALGLGGGQTVEDTRVISDSDPSEATGGYRGEGVYADARGGVAKALGKPLGEVTKVSGGLYKWVDSSGTTRYTEYDPTPKYTRDPVPGSNSAEVGRRAMANLTAEAEVNQAWDAREAADAAEFEKRTGIGGVWNGAKKTIGDQIKAPYYLARSVKENGLGGTAELILDGLSDTIQNGPSRIRQALDSGDAQTLTEAAAGALLTLRGGAGEGLIPRINLADAFKVKPKSWGYELNYRYPDTHGLSAAIDKEGVLGFEIKAGGDAARLGSGKDMFYSMMQRIQTENIQVNSIRGYWISGTGSTNYVQYRSGIEAGLSAQEAARQTWTAQRAAEYGYTEIQKIEDTGRAVKVWFNKPSGG